MPSTRRSFLWLIFLALGFPTTLNSQQPVARSAGVSPATIGLVPIEKRGPFSVPSLAQLARKAGYVFDGTVLSVVRVGKAPNAVPAMQITFRVERGIRGTQTGQVLTVREWAGLWEAGERYRPGERVVLFLYPPSKLGLTSPVAGAFGRFAVDSKGSVNVQPERDTVGADTASTQQHRRFSSEDFARAIQRPEVE
jgi:hypothetical protein